MSHVNSIMGIPPEEREHARAIRDMTQGNATPRMGHPGNEATNNMTKLEVTRRRHNKRATEATRDSERSARTSEAQQTLRQAWHRGEIVGTAARAPLPGPGNKPIRGPDVRTYNEAQARTTITAKKNSHFCAGGLQLSTETQPAVPEGPERRVVGQSSRRDCPSGPGHKDGPGPAYPRIRPSE